MSAYLVVDIDVTDPVRYEDYRAVAPAVIRQYGGRYLTRGGAVEVLEGDIAPKRVVVLEFPSMARATEFWQSPEYAAARAIRDEAATVTVMLLEGLAGQP